jgi:hypothetical protein
MVPGVTKRCPRSIGGNLQTSAARIARSAQSRRGLGFALRKTATSWRSTRSSTSLDADERPNNNSRFSSRTKTRYSRRNDTGHDHAPTADHTQTPGQRAKPTSGTPHHSQDRVLLAESFQLGPDNSFPDPIGPLGLIHPLT